MPQREVDLRVPIVKAAKDKEGKLILTDNDGHMYNKTLTYNTMKDAKVAADEWNSYYALPLGP